MNILIIVERFPVTTETFIVNKVLHLAKLGNTITVLCNSTDKGMYNRFFAGNTHVRILVANKVQWCWYLFKRPFGVLKAISLGRQMKQSLLNGFRYYLIQKQAPDIVHFEFSGIGIAYLDILPDLNAKIVVSCRGTAEKVKLLSDTTRQQQIRLLFNQAAAIHCVSADMQQTIAPYCNEPGKIFVNFPSIDTLQFKRRFSYKQRSPVTILSVGRFNFQKGYLTGLLAMQCLAKAGLAFQWVLVGDGPMKEELLFHINQLSLNDYVQFAGSKTREQLLKQLHDTDIFFLPSVYEGIANAALEAMSMEVPVVSTKSGGMAEVITHGVNGMLAEVYDHLALAAHLELLINNFAMRQSIGAAGRTRVAEQFTIQMQTAVFQTKYQQLLGI
ncbi:glycosyltransferase family 4 protein [Limnovirga soli]|uniref:Glycosyltransferase n=1 Tax=Limnovirga soli TaxID=2656915 RepID=A0A8J8FET9_9BACT|nr:glycosyltransferase family 4 protein [Limnovirga soli]NNV56593.1 glycosyltransferase [Limnovirga soli]